MDENNTTNVGTEDNTDVTTTVETNSNEFLNITQEDFDKKVQSESDKIRTHYSKEIKKLEDKIKELSPVEKSEAEKALDDRLAQLEAKQKEVEDKEHFLTLQTSLQAKNLDKALADYVKADIDVNAFETAITAIVNDRVKGAGYIPTSHQSNAGMTSDKWKNLSYSERVKFQEQNPEQAKAFLKR